MLKLALFAIGVFALDRIVKIWVLANFTMGEVRPFIPGFVQFRYTRNTGMAFSFLADHQWVFLVFVPLVLIGLGVAFKRGAFPCFVQQLALVAVMAGGFGNWVDRILYGSVVDMFEFTFMRFAIFNVADIFITCGAILFFIAYLVGEHRKKDQVTQVTEETPSE